MFILITLPRYMKKYRIKNHKKIIYMEIYKDKFVKYIYEKENSLVLMHWLEGSKDLTAEEYKKLMLKAIEFIELYKPKYLLDNSKDKSFIIDIELQKWVATNPLPELVKNGLKKFAVIDSEDVVSQISTEQAIDEHDKKEYEIKYFSDEQKAREWLANE